MIRFKKDDGLDYPDWKQFKLKEIAVYKKGFAFKAKDYKKEGVKIIRVSDLGYDYIKKAGQVCLSLDKKDEFLDWELKENDIIITTVGSKPPVYSSLVGKVIKVTKEFDGCLLNQNAIRVRTREGYSQKFLYYVFSKKRYISFLESIMRGNANQGNITVEDLFGYEMFIPAIQEQEKIADFLSSVDDVIQIQEEKIVALEEQKKGIMQKLFNCEVRFKADDGSEYPEWEEKEIGDACVMNPKTGKLDDEFYYIDLGSVDKGSLVLESTILRDDAPSRAQRVLSLDDVIFQSVRPYNMGHYHYTHVMDKQVVASTGFIQLRLKDGLNAFLYQLLYTAHFNNEVDIRCTGSNYPAINSDSLAEIKIDVPCIEEQKKIVDCLSAYDETIQIKKDKLEIWKEIKKGLLQQMFV